MTFIDPEEALKEYAINNAFSFTLDMIARTQGGVQPAECMEESLRVQGFDIVRQPIQDEIEVAMANAITVHACRADRACQTCGREAEVV